MYNIIKKNYIYIVIIIYVLYGLISIIFKNNITKWYMILLLFAMSRIIMNQNKCTFSYIECKIRGVSKENGYIYRFLQDFIDLQSNTIIYLCIIFYTISISYYYFIIKKNSII